MKASVYNLENKVTGEIELPEKIFGAKWHPALVAQLLNAQLANRRRPWAHAKTRAEVQGGGKKPWRQKGTGRARHGSIRSPLWIGGGKAHGPVKERDYSQKINKKMRRQAIFSILSKKLGEGGVKVFENFAMDAPKAKLLASILKNALNIPKKQKKYDVLFIKKDENKTLFRAASNLPKTKVLDSNSINVYDLLNHKNIFIAKEAVEEMAKHYKG